MSGSIVMDFLKSPVLESIAIGNAKTIEMRKSASFNLLTLSTYTAHLENFHSDVLAALLNPKGNHNGGNGFLFLFIEYLNLHYYCDLKQSEFENAIVTREKGRLDIWIRSRVSRSSIIIENKVNDAPDMDDQLDRYFVLANQKFGYDVNSILYLTLDGVKQPPPTAEAAQSIVHSIGYFTNKDNDLLNGWLIPCLKIASNIDDSSFLNQYIKLIHHLANKNMENENIENFYQFLSLNNGFKTLDAIADLSKKVHIYRADNFSKAIGNYSPFRKQYRYDGHYWIYDYFGYPDNHHFKLDVIFINNGNASVVFWNPGTPDIPGRPALTDKLTAIKLLDQFEDTISFGGNGYQKYFRIGDNYNTMKEVDEAITAFVKVFMVLLKSTLSSGK